MYWKHLLSKVNEDGMHETGHWGYCDETSIGNCPITYKNIDAMVRALSEYQKVLVGGWIHPNGLFKLKK